MRVVQLGQSLFTVGPAFALNQIQELRFSYHDLQPSSGSKTMQPCLSARRTNIMTYAVLPGSMIFRRIPARGDDLSASNWVHQGDRYL